MVFSLIRSSIKKYLLSSTRQRGVTLTEGILYLVIAASSITLVAGVLNSEQQRQNDVITAGTNRVLLEQAQEFVAVEYDRIRQEMFEAGLAAADATIGRTYTMQDLVDRGYLPPSFLEEGTVENRFGQEYFLLVRGVNRAEAVSGTDARTSLLTTDFPLATTWAEFETNYATPWLSDIPAPGQPRFDIEAVLLTSGGEDIPPNRGNRVSSATGLPTAGYLQTIDPEPFLSGPLGTYQLNLSGFQFLEEFPDLPAAGERDWGGYIGGIVSLSGFNDLMLTGSGAGGGGGGGGGSATFDDIFVYRCPEDPADPLYATCLNDPNLSLFTNIVFNDANTIASIENAQLIDMRDNGTISGNNLTVNVGGGTVNNASAITMADGGTISGTNVTVNTGGGNVTTAGGDINLGGGDITNVSSLGFDCGAVTSSATQLDIACNTEIDGTLVVLDATELQDSLTVGADVTIEGTQVDFSNQNVTMTANAGVLDLDGRLRVGNTTGYDVANLAGSVVADGDIFAGNPPTGAGTGAVPAAASGVAIRSASARVEANDFVLRSIDSDRGGFTLQNTIIDAADLTPNDSTSTIAIPQCDGVVGVPRVYVSINAVTSEQIFNGTDPDLQSPPLADFEAYEGEPLVGFRYETKTVGSEWWFKLIGKFTNLGRPGLDPDPATNPYVEVLLTSTSDYNRLFAITRCAPNT